MFFFGWWTSTCHREQGTESTVRQRQPSSKATRARGWTRPSGITPPTYVAPDTESGGVCGGEGSTGGYVGGGRVATPRTYPERVTSAWQRPSPYRPQFDLPRPENAPQKNHNPVMTCMSETSYHVVWGLRLVQSQVGSLAGVPVGRPGLPFVQGPRRKAVLRNHQAASEEIARLDDSAGGDERPGRCEAQSRNQHNHMIFRAHQRQHRGSQRQVLNKGTMVLFQRKGGVIATTSARAGSQAGPPRGGAHFGERGRGRQRGRDLTHRRVKSSTKGSPARTNGDWWMMMSASAPRIELAHMSW